MTRTYTVDFNGCYVQLEGWEAPYLHTWPSLVRQCVSKDAILVLRNFSGMI